MQKLKALLVDDEESARDVLENLLVRFCPDVTLIGKCENIPQAVEQIKKLQPDLVFLDIEMPQYAGYEIVSFFDQVDFEIVFVTAYDNYAIRAFDVAAVDYLLKPIDIERLKTAVSRVRKKSQPEKDEQLSILKNTLESKKINSILITDKGNQYAVSVKDIIAIEAEESYCQVYTTSRKYLVSKNLRHFETILEKNEAFFRVHKSWIINRNFMRHYSKSGFSISMTADITAKLSKYRKEEFEKWILGASIPE